MFRLAANDVIYDNQIAFHIAKNKRHKRITKSSNIHLRIGGHVHDFFSANDYFFISCTFNILIIRINHNYRDNNNIY